MSEQEATEHKGSLLDRLKQSWPFVLIGLLGVAAGSALDIADKVQKVFGRSDTLVLAENSDRARFSEALIRTAWKRLFFADMFATRVHDEVPWPSIEEAWKEYIKSTTEWNADLMVYIVGLERHYGQKKSEQFEVQIQSAMRAVDQEVRLVYLSDYVKNLQRSSAQMVDNPDKGPLDVVYERTKVARSYLYIFVRCFESGRRNEPPRPGCDLS